MIRLCSCSRVPLVCGGERMLLHMEGIGGWKGIPLMGQVLPASSDTMWNKLDRRDSLDLHQSSLDTAHPGGFCQKRSLQKAMMLGFLTLQMGQPS